MIEKWDWSAWHSEKGLQLCSLEARGLWFEILGIMAQAKPKGCLVSNGKNIGLEELAKLVNDDKDRVEKALAQLEHHGIFSRLVENNTIYCRRMYKKKKIKKEVVKKTHDEIDVKLTQYLINWITKNDPDSHIIARLKEESALQDKWVEECRRLRVLDKRSPELIKNVITWSQKNSFWKTNIRSMSKLRIQFDTLRMQSKHGGVTGVQDFIRKRQARNNARI